MGLEIVASSEQALSVTCSIFVARYLHVVVTQIRVRVRVGTGTISNVTRVPRVNSLHTIILKHLLKGPKK